MRKRVTSPIDRIRSNWRRLWGEPIGWVWLSAFLLHLIALFCVQGFVFYSGMSSDEHGLFIVQSMRFPTTEKPNSNPPTSRDGEISTEIATSTVKSNSPVIEKKVEELKMVDVPQWNPLTKLPLSLINSEESEEEEYPRGVGVKVWELKSPVKKVVFLIDVSGTMWNEIEGKCGFQIAQAEVTRSIKFMPPEMLFNIIYYSDSTSLMAPQLVATTPENKELGRAFLRQKPTLSGATDFLKGIQAAFEQQPEAIFIFTDGEMDIPRWKIPSLLDSLKEKIGLSIPLFGVGFFYEKNEDSIDVLQKICFSTGGDFKLYYRYSSPLKGEKKPVRK